MLIDNVETRLLQLRHIATIIRIVIIINTLEQTHRLCLILQLDYILRIATYDNERVYNWLRRQRGSNNNVI